MAFHLLIIRFSSFGDIVQAVAVPQAFRDVYPGAKIDWFAREDFVQLLQNQPAISQVHTHQRQSGLLGLISQTWKLARSGVYTHVYDAHSNIRSRIVLGIFGVASIFNFLSGKTVPKFAVRSKDRIRRFLFFKFRLKTLPQPFRGAESFHRPLKKWGLSEHVPQGPQFQLRADLELPNAVQAEFENLRRKYPNSQLIACAPSAAWEMKRWPLAHWKELMPLLPNACFVFLGGPADTFINDLVAAAPERSLNLAGKLSLDQSSLALKFVDLVIANDTGLLHVADQMERPTLALIGPTAFGYPSHSTSETLEVKLWCQPCSKDGRGGCKNDLYQRCLVELTPARVAEEAHKKLAHVTHSETSLS